MRVFPTLLFLFVIATYFILLILSLVLDKSKKAFIIAFILPIFILLIYVLIYFVLLYLIPTIVNSGLKYATPPFETELATVK